MEQQATLSTGIPISATLLTDAANINVLPRDALKAGIDAVCSFLLDAQGSDLVAAGDAIVEAHGIKAKPFRGVLRSILLLFQGASQQAVSVKQFQEDLEALGIKDAAAAEDLSGAWERHSLALVAAVSALAAVPRSGLVDVSWRFGVTVSTDDLRRAGATFVHLKLSLQETGGAVREEYLEMGLPQFYATLAALEKAQSYVAFLSGGGVAAGSGAGTS